MVKVRSYYGSYYTAYPTLVKSYATGVGTCTKNTAGVNQWCGFDSSNAVKCETGANCTEARNNFCSRHGPGGKCGGGGGGSTSTGIAVPVGGSTSLTKAALGGDDSPASKAADNIGKFLDDTAHGSPGSNPVSGCVNCNDDWWNPGQWGCQLGKMGCEFQQAIGGSANGLQQFFKDNIIFIAGGLIGFLFLAKMFRVI